MKSCIISPQRTGQPCLKTMMCAAAMLMTLFSDGFRLVAAKRISSNSNVDLAKATSNIISSIVEDGATVLRQRQVEDQMANWDINYINFTADLSPDSDDELEMYMEIGKDRKVASKLLAGDCENNITGIVTNATTPEVMPLDDTHSILRLGYSLDVGAINGSNIFSWNDTSVVLEFCQVLQLLTDDLAFVITTDTRKFTVEVDLSAEFALSQSLARITRELHMMIPGELIFENYTVPTTDDELERDVAILQDTITEVVGGAVNTDTVWTLINATVTTIGGEDIISSRRMLQDDSTIVEFNIFLKEPCNNATECEALKGTTTMYDNATSQLTEQINNGNFLLILKTRADSVGGRKLIQDTAAVMGDNINHNSHHDEYDNHQGRFLSLDDSPGVTSKFNSTDIVMTVLTPPDPSVQTGFANGETDVNSYVQACKCDSAQSFQCNTNVLVPNEQLFVCIWSIRSSEVEIDYLDSMNVIQDSNTLKVIENESRVIPSVTSREYVPNKDGVAVGTRLPSNIFTYATDESITITGEIVMKLAGDGTRRLQFATSDSDDNAPFQVKINLAQDTMNSGEEEDVWINSAPAVSSKGHHAVLVLGGIFILSYMMVW